MDTKELQIGDLVLYTEFGKNEFHRIEIVEPTRVWLNGCNTYVPDEFIEPIPLTSEILEKNVFKKFNFPKIEGQHEWSWWANTDVSVTLWCRKLDDNPMNGWMVRIDSYPATICCKIESVHELQHALRLFRIKKDIVL